MDLMRNFFKPRRKPFKVQDHAGNKKIGIVADSVTSLLEKAAEKFKVSKDGLQIVLETDGTEIIDDEYLQTLQENTTVVVLKKGESWNGSFKRIENLFRSLLTPYPNLRSDLEAILKDENNRTLLANHIKNSSSDSQKIKAKDRKGDPDWFQNHNGKEPTKEAVMKNCAKRRIRTFYSSVKSFGEKEVVMKDATENFHKELTRNDFYGSYFDRTCDDKESRFCDKNGWFKCEGAFDVASCPSKHMINPYASREQRIVFSTWNLDHGIEKSREILPRLKEAAETAKKNNQTLNWEYFYDLLFTRKNLKLVDVVCHDKKEHTSKKCNPKEFYI